MEKEEIRFLISIHGLSQVNTMTDRIETETMSRIALAELLDLIGPAFVLGHSQGEDHSVG